MVFNVDFPKLKCEYLHIQATNFMGTRKAGIATKVPEVEPDSPDGPIHLTVTPPRRAREQVNLIVAVINDRWENKEKVVEQET